jgi:carboxyl-terminal processing protease
MSLMARKRLSLFVLPLVVLVCSIAGGFYGPRVQAVAAASAEDQAATEKDVTRFTRFYAVVEQNFADKLDPSKAIYKGAIPGMLQTLDPHSNFFDPRDYQIILEEQRGRYSGVGMQVGTRNGKTYVMAPFPGSPAYRAGIRPGDVISFVNDKSADGLGTTEVADMLKGPKGTQVKIGVSREGSPDYISFTIVREDISRKTVEDAFWVKPDIAYVKILSFGDNTTRELEDTLKRLGENHIEGLVLDLRGNPGGLLNEAVAVSDHFLQRGQTVVSHRGRSSEERVYVAQHGNRGREYPIVVLVNRYSASAAEIVSGALQDHDRAWILGETTFGKGLVQSVYALPDHTGLALTTAHFYTPSGRLIQRDYSHESFYDYYFHRDGVTRNPNDVKMTDSGRTVYGGGGITPDEEYTTPKLDSLEAQLYRNGLFDFTRVYFGKHPTALPKGWVPDDATVNELHDYIVKAGETFTPDQFQKDRDWIRRYLAKEMYVYAFNVDESDRLFAMTDPEVELAVKALPKASALSQGAHKIIVERMGGQRGQ